MGMAKIPTKPRKSGNPFVLVRMAPEAIREATKQCKLLGFRGRFKAKDSGIPALIRAFLTLISQDSSFLAMFMAKIAKPAELKKPKRRKTVEKPAKPPIETIESAYPEKAELPPVT